MSSRIANIPTRTVRCSFCGAEIVVPPFRRNICCSICRQPNNVDRDSVRNVVNRVMQAFPNIKEGNPFNLLPNPPSNMPVAYPRVFGKKRALLIGITYSSGEHELKGTLNDVNYVAYLLSNRFQFPKECILILTDVDRHPSKIPTKANMQAAMRWLVSECTAGDSLVFYYSGHGTQKRDTTYNELDGYDEALCPVDYKKNGVILDNEINATIVRPLTFNVKLHALIDTCHSGTALDLPFMCRISRSGNWQWENHTAPSGEYKGTKGGLAILISGCDDNQNADTSELSSTTYAGAMTYSFIQAVESEPRTTYGRLLTSMRAALHDNGPGYQLSGPMAHLMRRDHVSTQEPQISSSEIFDIYRTPLLL